MVHSNSRRSTMDEKISCRGVARGGGAQGARAPPPSASVGGVYRLYI